MILLDTSVWIDHLRSSDEELTQLLGRYQVMTHPFVIGELAMDNLQHRNEILNALQNLPQVPLATENEVLGFIEQTGIHGVGIGYIDANLLAAQAAHAWRPGQRYGRGTSDCCPSAPVWVSINKCITKHRERKTGSSSAPVFPLQIPVGQWAHDKQCRLTIRRVACTDLRPMR